MEKKTVLSQLSKVLFEVSLLNSTLKLSFLRLFSINTSGGFIMVLHPSDEVFVRVEVLVVRIIHAAHHLVDVHLVAEEAADATESFAELVAIGGFIRDEVDIDAEFFVVHAKPVGEWLGICDLEVDTGLLILEVLGVLCLLVIEEVLLELSRDWVLDFVPHDLDVFVQHASLE